MSSSVPQDTTRYETGGPSNEGGRRGLCASALSTLRQALRGDQEQDFTSGPIGRAILLLAIPMVLEMLMESVFALCDVFYVSRLGVEAVASVGLTEALLTPLYAIAHGAAISVTALVARRVGEKQLHDAAVAGVQAIWFALAVAAVVAPVGVIFAADLLHLMGASAAVVEQGAPYTAIVLGSSVFLMLLFQINAIFRGAGDPAVSMRVLWLANGINIVLDPCLIFGLGPFPELGLTGAAVATAIGRGTGVAWQLLLLARGHSRIRVGRQQLALRLPVLLRLVRVSIGGISQLLIATASWIGLVRIIGSFGSLAVAGYTIAIRIIVVTLLPSWGLAGSAATMVGQSLGAGKPLRARASVWRAGLYNLLFLLLVAMVFIIMPEPLIRIFSSDPTVIGYGVSCLRIVAYGYGFYAYGMVLVQAFNGAGDTLTPTWINLCCFWGFQLPVAWLLAHHSGLAASGVFWSITTAEALMTVISVVVFRRGRWQNRRV